MIIEPSVDETATTFVLTGRLVEYDRVTPKPGAIVEIVPLPNSMPDPEANNVYDGTVTLITDGNGAFATPLVTLDGLYYTVRSGDPRTNNITPTTFESPAGGSAIDLADIISVTPSPIPPTDATALRAEFAAADSILEDALRDEFLAGAQMLTPNMFGTLGVGNDAAVLTNWLENVIGEGAHGWLKPRDGGYTLGDPVMATDLSELQWAMTGAGPGSKLIVPASNTVGAFILDATGTPRDAEVLIRDLTIVTQGVAQGVGISYTMTAGGNEHQRSITLENVRIDGEDPDEDCFDIGIDLSHTWRPYLKNVTVGGPFGTGITDDLTDGSPVFAATACVVLDDAYAWHVTDSQLWSAETILRDVGTNAEGGRVVDSQLANCRTGIKRSRTGAEPGLKILGSHVNARDTGIDVDGGKVVLISGCHIYNQDAGNEYSGTARDIYLRNTERVQILGNEFHYSGAADRINVHVDGSTLGRDSIIDANLFASGGTNGVLLGTLTSGITVGTANRFPGTYTKNVVDNSGVNDIFYADGEVWRMENHGNGSTVGPNFHLVRDSDSPAANDVLGGVTWVGKDSVDAETNYASARAHIVSPTNSSEAGAYSVWVMVAGALTKVGQFDPPANGQTALHILGNRGGTFTLDPVTHGTTDSGGSGFKVLRVPN